MQIDLTDRRVLVTGGGSGLGRAIATALFEAGADVAVHYASSADGAKSAVEEGIAAGRRGVAVQADLTRADEASRCVAEAAAHLDGLDILVNNAGHLVGRCKVEDMTEDFWRSVMEANLTTAFLTTRAAIPVISGSSNGRIVNIASLAAQNGGGPGSVAYAAAKSGLVGFTKGLAKELAGRGVTVNAVAPGFIGQTPFHDTFTSDEARRNIVGGIPLQREGTPADVAGAVCFLASDLSSYMTGETLDVNGGVLTR